MKTFDHIETDRLIMRAWRDEDFEPFLEMNMDPKVMEYFPKLIDEKGTRVALDWYKNHFDAHGYTFWATEEKKSGEFVGPIGMGHVDFEEHFTPAVEIGWRVGKRFWNQGYATEAAFKILEIGFNQLEIPEVVAITTPRNLPSRRVMEKIGMTWDEDGSFYHPKVSMEHELAEHVLYRLRRVRGD